MVSIQLNVLHLRKDKDDPGRLSISQAKERKGGKRKEAVRKGFSTEELVFATQISLRESGNAAASNLLLEAAETTPIRASKISLAWKKEKTARDTKVYSDEEAISLLVEAQLSKHQYNTIRLQAKTKGCNIYPSYNKVRAAKERCYPDSLIVTEDECEVKLQQLLDNTAKRLLLAQAGSSKRGTAY
jgi:hypothetical protein